MKLLTTKEERDMLTANLAYVKETFGHNWNEDFMSRILADFATLEAELASAREALETAAHEIDCMAGRAWITEPDNSARDWLDVHPEEVPHD
jgi:hypothetical protein